MLYLGLGMLAGILIGYFFSGITGEVYRAVEEARREEFDTSTYEYAYITDAEGNYYLRNPYNAYKLPNDSWADRKVRAGVPVLRRRVKVLDSWEPYRS